MSFVDWRSFQTNKRVIRFYRELVSRNRNLNEVEIYYFCQFTILTPFLSCWLINLGVFLTGKKAITNFLNSLNISIKNKTLCFYFIYIIFILTI